MKDARYVSHRFGTPLRMALTLALNDETGEVVSGLGGDRNLRTSVASALWSAVSLSTSSVLGSTPTG